MKGLKNYIFLLLGVFFLLQSCVKEEADLFEKSGAERLNEAQKYYEKILTSAPNGWVLEYIAGDVSANRRGAFNYLLKFENGQVIASVDALAMSDIKPGNSEPFEKKTSLYRFGQDMSVTLSFSTYNSFLHYYHEQHGSYTTYKGDFEFTVMEAYDDLVVLRGKKYGNIMEMHRMPENVTWEEYLEKVNTIIDMCNIYSNFEIMQNNQVVGTGSTNENNRYTFELDKDTKTSSNAIFTTTGIKFIDSLSVNNVKVQNFKWDDTNKTYISTDKGVDIKIVPKLSPSYLYYEQYIGTFKLDYNNTLSTTVTIEEKVKGKTFTLKGLSDFDIELGFDKINGAVNLLAQDVGKSGGYTVSINPWDSNAGYLNYSLTIGLTSILNLEKLNNESVIEFSMVDNGVWGTYKTTGFLLRLYDSVLGGHSSATYKGYYSGSGNRFHSFTFTKQ